MSPEVLVLFIRGKEGLNLHGMRPGGAEPYSACFPPHASVDCRPPGVTDHPKDEVMEHPLAMQYGLPAYELLGRREQAVSGSGCPWKGRLPKSRWRRKSGPLVGNVIERYETHDMDGHPDFSIWLPGRPRSPCLLSARMCGTMTKRIERAARSSPTRRKRRRPAPPKGTRRAASTASTNLISWAFV